MEPRLRQKVEAAILHATGAPATVAGEEVVGGGSIGDTRRLRLADGRRYFLKSRRGPSLPGLFAAEEKGLAALRQAGVLRVPAVIAADSDFLLLEQIEIRGPGADFFTRFGRELARLHREARATTFGFATDNYLGASPQPNTSEKSWTRFWRNNRLGHQLARLRQQGLADRELDQLGEKLMDRLPEWLDEVEEAPSLLHGDLWAGNFLSDQKGNPVLVDPAVYYGHREAELAMTRLFGGFPPDFYAAYQETWPLAPGAADRAAIYELYHLLNHYNLFGAAYRGPCLEILRRLV